MRLRVLATHAEWYAEWVSARDASADEPDIRVIEPQGTTVLASENIACWSFNADSAATPRRDHRSNPTAAARNTLTLAADSAAVHAVARQMFAFDMVAPGSVQEAPPIAAAVVHAAWADWLRRISALVAGFSLEPKESPGIPGTTIPSDPWSGALCVHWTWCGGTWTLGLPHDAVAALLGSNAGSATPGPTAEIAPRQRLDQALSDQRIALRVTLNGAELNLGQLQELRLDDVVPLAHSLDSPVQVVGANGTPVCDGWLGQLDGHIAVELAAPAAAWARHAATVETLSNTHHVKEKTR